MNKIYFFILFYLLFTQANAQTSVTTVWKKQHWLKERVAPRVRWRQAHFDSLFGAKEMVNRLIVPARSRRYRWRVHVPGDSLLTLSEQVKRQRALAGLNAGFFDMKNGGSVDYVKINGTVVDTNRLGPKEMNMLNEHRRAAVVITETGRLDVRQGSTIPGWESALSEPTVLVSGPLLVWEGQAVLQTTSSFSQTRHPRTCVCVDKRNRVQWWTIDGRDAQSAGVSLSELAQLLQAAGCQRALNLDGGGSTTLFVQGKGVLNNPSDDKKWGPAGERAVSSVLLLTKIR